MPSEPAPSDDPAALQRHRFGRRAESLPLDQLQLGLGEAEQAEAADEAGAEAAGPTVHAARVAHAYAGTVYAAQGRTVADAVLYVGGATDAREVYVGLTRHRHDTTMVVERERLDTAARVRQTDPHLVPSDAELHKRLYVESWCYADKRNVVDHVEDRAAFIRTGQQPPPAPEPRLDIRLGVKTGRGWAPLCRRSRQPRHWRCRRSPGWPRR